MIHTIEMFMWGTRIGILHMDRNMPYAAFEYDRNFLKSGIELSPIKMPLSGKVYEFPDLQNGAFHGLPGLAADSLPDKFGNAVINQWLASMGRSENDFNALDRLCYIGKRGMGALEYVPSIGPVEDIDEPVSVTEMTKFASKILGSRKKIRLERFDELTYSQLLQLGTSAGGARAKALIAWNGKTGEVRSGQITLDKDFDYWLMKFDGVSGNGDHGLKDAPQYTLIEYAYYKMASLAGIHMNECRIFEENGLYHFMTKRFDRADGRKLHMQTLGALAHIDYNIPGFCGYEQAAVTMRKMGLFHKEIEEFYRRMVFNVLAVNQDDHVKNVSFLMEKDGTWKLSPAYDMTFAYNPANQWISAHQMTVNGKREVIEISDMLQCGRSMDISTRRCNRIIEEVQAAVSRWMEIAAETGVREQDAAMVQDVVKRQQDLAWK